MNKCMICDNELNLIVCGKNVYCMICVKTALKQYIKETKGVNDGRK